MADRYRLTRRQHFRVESVPGDLTPKLITYIKGDVLEPRPDELTIHRNKFEGPLDPQTPLTIGLKPIDGSVAVETLPEPESTAVITEVSPKEKAQQILKQSEAQIREAIRQADPEFLQILGETEALQEKPRPRVVSMIASHLKQLAT